MSTGLAERLLTSKQAAEMLGLSEQTLRCYRWEGKKDFPQPRYLGRRSVRYLESEVIAYIENLPDTRD